MNEEVELFFDDAKERMEKTIDHLENELSKIRAGKASTNMLDSILVDYYGTSSPLHQVSNIGVPDAKTIRIQPWEKNMIPVIEKAIMQANIGFTPQNNGEVIILNVPALTEERRKQLVKQVKTEGEQAKVGIRAIRRDLIEQLKKMQKEGLPEDDTKKAEDEAQELTKNFTEKIDKITDKKEKDIMTV